MGSPPIKAAGGGVRIMRRGLLAACPVAEPMSQLECGVSADETVEPPHEVSRLIARVDRIMG